MQMKVFTIFSGLFRKPFVARKEVYLTRLEDNRVKSTYLIHVCEKLS